MAEKKQLNKSSQEKTKPHHYQKPKLIKYHKVKQVFGAAASSATNPGT